MTHSSSRQALLAVSAVLLMLASGAAAAAAGKVVFSGGDVRVERAGKSTSLAKGADIEQGDMIITGADGRVQFRMADGDFMALRPNTRLKIDRYKAPASPKQPETGVTFFSLLKGGFRAVTHSLDRRSTDSYRIKTPVATLGIRGSKFNGLLCAGDCPGTPDGLYTGVTEGGINLTNNGGTMGYGPGEYGYVKDENTPPAKLPDPPSGLQNGNGNGGGGGGGDTGGAGYTGGSPPQGCTNPMSGDVNCPPVQPIHGGDVDLTGGHLPSPPPVREEPPPPPPPPPPIDECVECSPR